MKYLSIVLLILFSVTSFFSQTISVSGSNNCIQLEKSKAAHISLPAGVYKLEAYSPNNNWASKNIIFYRYASAKGDKVGMIKSELSNIIEMRNQPSFSFFAFFTDWSYLGDNPGKVQLIFTNINNDNKYYLSVVGSSNCLQLEKTKAEHISLSAGEYKMTAEGNNNWAGQNWIFYRYAGTNGDNVGMIKAGTSTIIEMRNQPSYSFFAFFTDWSYLGDNPGIVTLRFEKIK